MLLNASPRDMLRIASPTVLMDSPSTAMSQVVNGKKNRAEIIRTMIGRSISIILALVFSSHSFFISPGASPYFTLKRTPLSASSWLFFIGP